MQDSRPDVPWLRRDWLIALALIVGTCLVFSPSFGADFINFDDPVYVTENVALQEGFTLDTVAWAFQERQRSGHWHPLTWLSLALDFEIFGMQPWGFHFVNIVLHALNAVLVFAVFRRATGQPWPSALVAALFAWHPLNVETVAWVSGRKDLLAAFFWLVSTLVYLHAIASGSRRLYFESLALFALALLSKPMAVTLPLTLLLWDAWIGRPSKSWSRLVAEKIPFFLLSAASAALTLTAMSGGGPLRSIDQWPWPQRIANVLGAHVEYLRNAVWPVELTPFYPLTTGAPDPGVIAFHLGILVAITALAVGLRRREPALAFGWLWFLIVLLPVNGLVKTGAFAFADRYVYLPMIGLFTIAAFATSRWASRGPRATTAAWLTVLVVFGIASWRQTWVWHDSVSLWTHTLTIQPNHYLAHFNLGCAYESVGESELALDQFEKATAIRPEIASGRYRLGLAYLRVNRRVDGLAELREAAARDERYRAAFESAQTEERTK